MKKESDGLINPLWFLLVPFIAIFILIVAACLFILLMKIEEAIVFGYKEKQPATSYYDDTYEKYKHLEEGDTITVTKDSIIVKHGLK